MERMILFTFLISVVAVEIMAQVPTSDDPNSFWYGTQDLSCLTAKGSGKVKRSASTADLEAIARSTVQYTHRVLYYKGQVFEWGAGTRGYYFGPTASVSNCSIEWEEEPAGSSHCDRSVLERFTRRYRRRYGGYNMVTNNCHHFANRLGLVLLSDNCSIGEDKWVRFYRKYGAFMTRFIAAFTPGSEAYPATEQREGGSTHTMNDWPIMRWYRK